jgi:serine/threonine protein kinase
VSLKKFEILEMVAKGGMAEVYRAKTVGVQGFEKEVCVKKILPHLTEDESFVTMFVNEAKLAATLNYANIVHVHDLCVSASGEYFIVMEYVHGKDLSDVIRAAQLAGREIPPDIATYVCREVCKGLHYAHEKTDLDGAKLNIIHRDISPHNVLVSFMGEVKITDFGIAKASSIVNKTAVGILKGKYGYMSPEQARGQPLDHRSDIFNTGIVLYELLVGERCFAGSSDFSTLNLMRNAEVTPPTKINAQIPAGLEKIVLRSLSRERNDRYQDALELERALGQFAKSESAVCTATDAADFMRELFANVNEEMGQGSSTGVLSLSSVVGPPPKSEDEKAAHEVAPPRGPTPDVPAGPDAAAKEAEPGQEALARAKRRATKAKAKAEPPAPEPKVEAPAPAPAEPKPKAPKPAPKKEEKPAEDKPASAPKKKPARIKPVGKADKAGDKPAKPAKKKKGKQLSSTPKKPVGRRDLRPGLTALHKIRGSSTRRRWVWAASIIAIGLIGGGALGYYRSEQVSRQATFREMEIANREGGAKPMVTVLIDTDPRGATVRFDTIELSERTPVTIRRDRDEDVHNIELTLANHKVLQTTVKYESGSLTLVNEKLDGDPRRVEITSEPKGLEVKLGSKELGRTPVFTELAIGEHTIEVGGGPRELVKKKIVVASKGTTKTHVVVPKKGAMGSAILTTSPRARIVLDGEATEHFTNDGPMPLAPGVDHRVSFSLNGAPAGEELVVRLERGETKAIYIDLRKPAS